MEGWPEVTSVCLIVDTISRPITSRDLVTSTGYVTEL